MSIKNGKKLSFHKRIMQLLEDGQWHTFQEVHQAVARFVDADAADREYRKRHPGWKDDKPTIRVAQGKKRLIWLSLNSAIHHAKTVTARGHAADRKYRLTAQALKSRRSKQAKPVEQHA